MSALTKNLENDAIIEMLEIYINSILYKRKLYPEAVFRVRKAYNIPIYVSIYEALNKHIASTLQTARELNRAGKLHRLVIAILTNGQPSESYTFQFDHQGFALENDENMIHFEEEVRKSLLSLDARMKDLPTLDAERENTTFKIYLQCPESAHVQIAAHPRLSSFPFVKESITSQPLEESKVQLLPVVHTKHTGIDIFVEEHVTSVLDK
ncbi:rev7 [Anopheles darlingi]|uniref:Rev7 n=1 Tax=Anopheles darlingi TaxID=43151 RepID=W5J776_ANODA|nr:rev7 [Anopheles darlingi]